MRADDLADKLRQRWRDVVVARGEATVTVDRGELLAALEYVRDEEDLSLRFLADVSCSDWPARDPRIWMAYHLLSLEHGHRLRVKVGLAGDDLRIPSVVPIHPTANWQEREVFDMFGVTFEGHPDLRRILMPEDWEGYPLRKDHALGGVATQYKGATVPPPDQRGL
ncbi:MAG TPA: NADH-quinone oxidoreductase subunit C [Actinomycetota bacterium]|nr:NADH-quinone oxidoreductase subunit C [Actinomycetota bacterium]